MDFGDCNKCQQYKFLKENGQCQSCYNSDSEVKLDFRGVHRSISTPTVLAAISKTMESRQGVTHIYGDTNSYVRDDILDIGPDYCYLLNVKVHFEYANQSGSTKSARVTNALDKLYNVAIDKHGAGT